MQDTIEKNKNTYFKLTLPNKGNKLKVGIWASKIFKQVVQHLCTAIHACKQIWVDVNFTKAKVALKSTNHDLDIVNVEYISEKKNAKEHKEKGEKQTPRSEVASSLLIVGKATYKKAMKAVEAAKLAITT